MSSNSIHRKEITPSNKTRSGSRAQSDSRSRWLAYLCLLFAFVLPLSAVVVLVQGWPNALLTAFTQKAAQAGMPTMTTLSLFQGSLAAALALVPVGLMASALWHAYRCFIRFSRGDYFTRDTVRSLRRFGFTLFFAAIACIVIPPIIGVIATFGGPGKATLAVSIGSHDVVLLLFAGVVWQMASVMVKAADIAEENEQFI
jgi:Protein of unknown function (DUF2975)